MNLVSVCHSEDPAVLWGFIRRNAPGAAPDTAPILDGLVGYAIAYYRDVVKPNKRYRKATPDEAQAFADLKAGLETLGAEASAESLQDLVYEIGKRACFADLKSWFKTCYEVLLGNDQGPRMGSFIKLFGIPETIALLDKAIRGEDM